MSAAVTTQRETDTNKDTHKGTHTHTETDRAICDVWSNIFCYTHKHQCRGGSRSIHIVDHAKMSATASLKSGAS